MMPWYTLGMLEYLNSLDLSSKAVWEYGAGYSTMWWRSISDHCGSVDDSQQWSSAIDCNYAKVLNQYVTYPNINQYDIVCIDGSYRKECLQYAIDNCAKGTMIICDNWLQPSAYSDWGNMEEVVAKYNPVVFKQPNHEDWQTMYFYL
jgi:hypothetical protein